MKYSDWQLNRIRDALRAYHHYGRMDDGRYLSWAKIREAIAIATDVEIGTGKTPEKAAKNGAERLRQFVEGRNVKGVWKLSDLIDEWVDAVVAFLSDEERHLLSSSELEEYSPQYQAPLRLLEYFRDGCETEGDLAPSNLQGKYLSFDYETYKSEKLVLVRQITIQLPLDTGMAQVIEVETAYDKSVVTSMDVRFYPDWYKNYQSVKQYGGWAVISPEDNMIFFMKNQDGGHNHIYQILASDYLVWSKAFVNRLVLQRQCRPIAFDIPEKSYHKYHLLNIVANETRENILLFDRQLLPTD